MTDRDRGDDSYTGRAGQQAFVAQVLLRFGNAAVPVVDVGTDVIVFRDRSKEIARVQVKTGKLVPTPGGGQEVQFNLPLDQLDAPDDPPLFYALVTRDAETSTFPDFIILSRSAVQEYMGRPEPFVYSDAANNAVKLKVKVAAGEPRLLRCRQVDLTRHRGDWEALPPLKSPPSQATESSAGADSSAGNNDSTG